MLGGNIKGQNRVLTTATVMEAGKGNFDVAIARSLILLPFCFAANTFVAAFRRTTGSGLAQA